MWGGNFLTHREILSLSGRAAKRLQRDGIVSLLCLAGLAAASWATSTPQPGVVYFEPAGIELSNFSSGPLCAGGRAASGVCTAASRVVITGRETCEHSDGNRYPCTWFGYEFEYRGARPGSTIDCTVKRQDPMGRSSTKRYEHRLEGDRGRIFYPSYRTYGPVDERLIFSEVHECSYGRERLTSIEYIIYYEPGTESADRSGSEEADRYFDEVPLACSAPHLTEARARSLLGATRVKASAANEHVPVLQSQCIFSARGGDPRQVGYVYKFMLSDLFDVDRLQPAQVQFNATFASGGAELTATRNELGDRAFVFLKGDRTSLLVITGIRGRKDFAGRDQEFIANYYLEHPGLTHEQRTDMLIDVAEQDLRIWSGSAP